MTEPTEGSRSRPKRSLGQNFLVDPNLQRKIVEALRPARQDRVLEIGPGRGALTGHLVNEVDTLILVELDDELVSQLRRMYGGRPNVRIIHADILEVPIADLADGRSLKAIGNIPYGITSPLIFHLLEAHSVLRMAVLTVQREVAERLAARPGTKDYGALTVGVQALAEVEILFPVSRNAFRPRPDVDSTTVRIVPGGPSPLSPTDQRQLRQLTRSAFSRRRKQLQKVLRTAPEYGLSKADATAVLEELDIDPRTRPDALPVEDYLRLAHRLAGVGRDG